MYRWGRTARPTTVWKRPLVQLRNCCLQSTATDDWWSPTNDSNTVRNYGYIIYWMVLSSRLSAKFSGCKSVKESYRCPARSSIDLLLICCLWSTVLVNCVFETAILQPGTSWRCNAYRPLNHLSYSYFQIELSHSYKNACTGISVLRMASTYCAWKWCDVFIYLPQKALLSVMFVG